MAKNKYKTLENIQVFGAGAKGLGIGKTEDGKTILISNAVPGDVVDVQVRKSRRRYIEAYVIKHHVLSPNRVEPKCEHFGVCGGCKWQSLSYEEQLNIKQNEVFENLSRLGGLSDFEVEEILPSQKKYFYRNKMEFSFSNSRWLTQEEISGGEDLNDKNALGFHIPGMWSKVLDLKNCYLQSDLSEKIRLAVRDYAINNNCDFFDIRNQEGFLRTLMIRNTELGEYMVLIQFFRNEENKINALLNFLKTEFPQITSLVYAINPKGNDSIYDLDIQLHYGKPFIQEKLGAYTFKISPKSFFQTNSTQAEKLYKLVADFANIQTNEIVYDLYSGTGTIGIYLSDKCKKIVGVESVKDAVDAAKENASNNNVSNASFYCGDMKNLLADSFFTKNGKPDVIITDPPRDGMHKNVVEAINNSGAKRVVYVSCNSATQARDLALMEEHYKLIKIRPVDLFPQTHHVENVALLVKKT